MKAMVEPAAAAKTRAAHTSSRPLSPGVQAKLTVNSLGDRHEREADAAADRVMRMPAAQAIGREPERIQRAMGREDEKLQRIEAPPGGGGAAQATAGNTGTPAVSDEVQAGIRANQGGGNRLDAQTRQFMESRFSADFGAVRVHADAESDRLNRQLRARAFTAGNHVFFADGQYDPGSREGKRLLAHELTHTLQQGAAIQRSPWIEASSSAPAVQRLGLSDALDYFAERAYLLLGFRMLTILLGFNPINRAPADRSAGNLLRALIELLPGGTLVSTALATHGVFERAGEWVLQQLGAFANLGGQIQRALQEFLATLKWTDVWNFSDVWSRAQSIFTTPIASILAFGKSLLTGMMDLVRDALLAPLAHALRSTRGYDLLCAVLGRDPVTGSPVPRTAETLIGGFMKLIGREEIWENLKKGNAVARAWAWFQAALSGLMAFALAIPTQVVAVLRSITWQDVVSITGVLSRFGGLFLDLAGRFVGWASGTVMELLDILFSVVAPGVMPYIQKARATFHTILNDPVGFVGNLVRAARLGFEGFARNILTHLKSALVKWITGPLGEAGVYVPQSFELVEIVKLVLSVLGLTWQNIRAKLVKIIPEPVLVTLEKTASILVTLVKDGPAAAWEQIKSELSELKSMLVAEVTNLVATEVVKAAVTKIVSMINPAGAVIQAIIAIYNTIMFFVERIHQIAATVAAFVDSISAIATGQLAPAAQKVEQTLANTLVVVISFLARLVGLGGIPQRIVAIVKKIRQPIDKGLDRIVAWLGKMLQQLKSAAKGAATSIAAWWKKSVPVRGGGEAHTLTFQGERKAAKLVLMSRPQLPSEFLAEKASENKIAEAKRRKPIQDAVDLEGNIRQLQATVSDYDNPSDGDPRGSERKAKAASTKLDKILPELGTHIAETLTQWNVKDELIDGINVLRLTKDLKLRRPGWRSKTKQALGPLPAGYDRRHIVSSSDMAEHYKTRLSGTDKKASQAKLLLEERGSAGGARVPVPDLTKRSVEQAAQKRHANFFNDLSNLFVGPGAINQEVIQEHLDNQKPGMVEAELNAHIRYVSRGWALDDRFVPSPAVTEPVP